jgi:hypothetical protein
VVDGGHRQRRTTLHRANGCEGHDMFEALGILVLLYTGYAACTGEVHAKSGWRGRRILRSDSSGYFWAVIACYGLLGVALLTVF